MSGGNIGLNALIDRLAAALAALARQAASADGIEAAALDAARAALRDIRAATRGRSTLPKALVALFIDLGPPLWAAHDHHHRRGEPDLGQEAGYAADELSDLARAIAEAEVDADDAGDPIRRCCDALIELSCNALTHDGLRDEDARAAEAGLRQVLELSRTRDDLPKPLAMVFIDQRPAMSTCAQRHRGAGRLAMAERIERADERLTALMREIAPGGNAGPRGGETDAC